jgi:hypothetical protein
MGSIVCDTSLCYIKRDANLPSSSSYSMCGWFKPTTAIADYRWLMLLTAGSAPRHVFAWSSTLQVRLESATTGGGTDDDGTHSIVTNDWYFVAMSCAGTGATDLKGYMWTADGTLVVSAETVGLAVTPIFMSFGGSDYNSNRHLAGLVGRGRVWDAVLSVADFEAEMFSESVVRSTDFNSGFIDASTLGVSPQASRTWSLSDTSTSSDTPPVLTGCTITDAGDELYRAGDSVTITGTNFGAVEGDVYVSPTDDVTNAAKVAQTVTSWADTSITFTAVRSTLATGSTLYLFVVPDTNDENADGYSVAFEYVPITLTWAM